MRPNVTYPRATPAGGRLGYPPLLRADRPGAETLRGLALRRFHRYDISFPPRGLPRGGIPPLQRYYEMFRRPAAHPAALRCLRLAVPSVRLCSSLHADPAPVRRPGVLQSDNPQVAHVGWRRPGLPGSWRTLVHVPCSRTPTGPPRQASCDASVLPSAFSTASAPAITVLTGLNHTARTLAVYASQCRSPGHHARLATGWAANPSRAGLAPAGLQREVSAHASPFPRLILAQAKRSQSDRILDPTRAPVERNTTGTAHGRQSDPARCPLFKEL